MQPHSRRGVSVRPDYAHRLEVCGSVPVIRIDSRPKEITYRRPPSAAYYDRLLANWPPPSLPSPPGPMAVFPRPKSPFYDQEFVTPPPPPPEPEPVQVLVPQRSAVCPHCFMQHAGECL